MVAQRRQQCVYGCVRVGRVAATLAWASGLLRAHWLLAELGTAPGQQQPLLWGRFRWSRAGSESSARAKSGNKHTAAGSSLQRLVTE